jgi:hypothetical protein
MEIALLTPKATSNGLIMSSWLSSEVVPTPWWEARADFDMVGKTRSGAFGLEEGDPRTSNFCAVCDEVASLNTALLRGPRRCCVPDTFLSYVGKPRIGHLKLHYSPLLVCKYLLLDVKQRVYILRWQYRRNLSSRAGLNSISLCMTPPQNLAKHPRLRVSTWLLAKDSPSTHQSNRERTRIAVTALVFCANDRSLRMSSGDEQPVIAHLRPKWKVVRPDPSFDKNQRRGLSALVFPWMH